MCYQNKVTLQLWVFVSVDNNKANISSCPLFIANSSKPKGRTLHVRIPFFLLKNHSITLSSDNPRHTKLTTKNLLLISVAKQLNKKTKVSTRSTFIVRSKSTKKYKWLNVLGVHTLTSNFILMLFRRQVLCVFALKCIIHRFGISLNVNKWKNQLWPSVIWGFVN